MKVSVVSGLRFNGPQVVSGLEALNFNIEVVSSSPSKYWTLQKRTAHKFVPMPSAIASRILNLGRSLKFKEYDSAIFEKLASLRINDGCEVVHGMASFSLSSGKKVKSRGGKFFLDRACPHIISQIHLLQEESERVGVKYQPPSQRFIDRCFEEYELADKIIVPSSYTRNSFLKKGFNLCKIWLAPLDANISVDVSRIAKSPPCITAEGGVVTVGFVGGNVLRKGVVDLLQAWSAIDPALSCRLLFKGSRDQLSESPKILSELRKLKNVEFVNYVPDMIDYYNRCDILCLPSIDDGFGMVAVEAHRCGLPVVISDNVGAADILAKAPGCAQFPARDSQKLQSFIEYFIKNKDLIVEERKNILNYYNNNEGDLVKYPYLKDVYEN